MTSKQIQEAVLELLTERGTATASPSEIARALQPHDWRPLMQPVLAAAARPQHRRKVDVYQRGAAVRLSVVRAGPT